MFVDDKIMEHAGYPIKSMIGYFASPFGSDNKSDLTLRYRTSIVYDETGVNHINTIKPHFNVCLGPNTNTRLNFLFLDADCDSNTKVEYFYKLNDYLRDKDIKYLVRKTSPDRFHLAIYTDKSHINNPKEVGNQVMRKIISEAIKTNYNEFVEPCSTSPDKCIRVIGSLNNKPNREIQYVVKAYDPITHKEGFSDFVVGSKVFNLTSIDEQIMQRVKETEKIIYDDELIQNYIDTIAFIDSRKSQLAYFVLDVLHKENANFLERKYLVLILADLIRKRRPSDKHTNNKVSELVCNHIKLNNKWKNYNESFTRDKVFYWCNGNITNIENGQIKFWSNKYVNGFC